MRHEYCDKKSGNEAMHVVILYCKPKFAWCRMDDIFYIIPGYTGAYILCLHRKGKKWYGEM